MKMVQDPDKICIWTLHDGRSIGFWSGLKKLLTWTKFLKILKGKVQDPDAIFATDKKKNLVWILRHSHPTSY